MKKISIQKAINQVLPRKIQLRGAVFALFSLMFLFASCASKKLNSRMATVSQLPKREFRAAWIQTVYQDEYARLSTEAMQRLFVERLDKLKAAGCNAVIFQIRPESDAWYASEIEPWSKFLTGKQGRAPQPYWDPLAFLIEECHSRAMELHAWINPYRASTSAGAYLAPNHPYNRYPERFVTYNNQLYYDPGYPENRAHICRIVKDVLLRYDVDAIHMDDYFYPYPVAGLPFPDEASFTRYGKAFGSKAKADWRRDNVNQLVREIKETILSNKPWVRFGISPFGIYRNEASTADRSGSKTYGLQNYDDLYADVLLWLENRWIDYVIPQIYWEIGHKSADYLTLTNWWGRQKLGIAHLYIGQDVKRTMDARQLTEKLELERSNSQGHAWWPAGEVYGNYRAVSDSLKRYHQRYASLIPAFDSMHKNKPSKVKGLHVANLSGARHLLWLDERKKNTPEHHSYYVVYAFRKGVKKNYDNPRNILAITGRNSFKIPADLSKETVVYAVTAVDRFHNESKAKKIKVKP